MSIEPPNTLTQRREAVQGDCVTANGPDQARGWDGSWWMEVVGDPELAARDEYWSVQSQRLDGGSAGRRAPDYPSQCAAPRKVFFPQCAARIDAGGHRSRPGINCLCPRLLNALRQKQHQQRLSGLEAPALVLGTMWSIVKSWPVRSLWLWQYSQRPAARCLTRCRRDRDTRLMQGVPT
jgi:hypothetical protein